MPNGHYSANPVIPNLWIGEEPPPGACIGEHFDVLVLAAREIQDARKYPRVAIMKVPLEDDGHPPTEDEIGLAIVAGWDVANLVSQGRMVLSTCHLGKNRSALVAALALRNLGWSPERIIRTIRKCRGEDALTNQWFEEIVRSY